MADKWTSYKNEYTAEHYARLSICVPAAMRDGIRQRAAALGLSVNAYVAHLIAKDLGLEPAAWGMGLRPDPHRPRD